MNDATVSAAVKINHITSRQLRALLSGPSSLRFYDRGKGQGAALAAAVFLNGFDAGPFTVDSSKPISRSGGAYLQQVGIRTSWWPMDRARLCLGLPTIISLGVISRAIGGLRQHGDPARLVIVRAAPRLGSYPDFDELYAAGRRTRPQEARRDPERCSVLSEKAINAPVWELAFLHGRRSAVGEAALGLLDGFPYPAPFEDIDPQSAY